MSKYSTARMESNRKWDGQNLDRISIAIPKGNRDRIKAHAEKMGESMNKFIARAVEETIERDSIGNTTEETEGAE